MRVFRNPWLPRPSSFQPITRPTERNVNLCVADLIVDGRWSLPALENHLWEIDKELVLSLPFGTRCWFFDNKEIYSVRYPAIGWKCLGASGPSIDVSRWRKLWACNVPRVAWASSASWEVLKSFSGGCLSLFICFPAW